MGYIPKFIHFDRFISVYYPLGVHWKREYIEQCSQCINNAFKDTGKKTYLVGRGTSGAMIAGAILNEIGHINPNMELSIVISRKDNELCHADSLEGLTSLNTPNIIVVDDFISSGRTINAIIDDLDGFFIHLNKPRKKYDMLCISNFLDEKAIKKNGYEGNNDWMLYKDICRRFKYVACCPNR